MVIVQLKGHIVGFMTSATPPQQRRLSRTSSVCHRCGVRSSSEAELFLQTHHVKLFQHVVHVRDVFCCVAVDEINDTMAAFYNDTDLFSGEFQFPRPPTHSQTPTTLFLSLYARAPNSQILRTSTNPPLTQRSRAFHTDLFPGDIWLPLVFTPPCRAGN